MGTGDRALYHDVSGPVPEGYATAKVLETNRFWGETKGSGGKVASTEAGTLMCTRLRWDGLRFTVAGGHGKGGPERTW